MKLQSILNNKGQDLTRGPLVPKILLFALPLMITGILQLMFNAADLIVVGQFAENGQTDIGAIGGTGPLINLVINLFMGFSVGTSVYVARYIGAKDAKKTHETVHTSIALALIGGVVCLVVGLIFARTFLEWMNTIPEYIELSTLYMRIYFIGIPATLIYNFGAAILRAAGDTFHPLLFLTISGCANVALNLVMVLVFKRSVDGVAIASAAAQCISALLVLWYLSRKAEGDYRLEFRKIRIYKDRLFEIVRIGIPAGLQGSLFSISNIVIQSAVNSFNSTAVASGSVASTSIEGFIYIAMHSFHHAALSFHGQNIGAGKPEKIGKITGTCLWMVTAVGMLLGALATLFGRTLLHLYIGSGEPEAVDASIGYGFTRLSIIATTNFLSGIMDVLNGSLRGMGYSTIPTLICLSGVCGVRILWIYTYFPSHHTLETLFFSYPLSWTITVIAQLVFFFILRRKVIARFSAAAAAKEPVDA